MKRITYFALLLFVLSTMAACQRQGTTPAPQVNGEGYGGRSYYWLDPEATCPGSTQPSYKGVLNVAKDGTASKLDPCTGLIETVSNLASYQTSLDGNAMSDGDGIYEYYEAPPDLTQQSLTYPRSWCYSPQKPLEFLVRLQPPSTHTVRYSEWQLGKGIQSSTFPVDVSWAPNYRAVQSKEIPPAFTAYVYFNLFDVLINRYPGELTWLRDGATETYAIRCIVLKSNGP